MQQKLKNLFNSILELGGIESQKLTAKVNLEGKNTEAKVLHTFNYKELFGCFMSGKSGQYLYFPEVSEKPFVQIHEWSDISVWAENIDILTGQGMEIEEAIRYSASTESPSIEFKTPPNFEKFCSKPRKEPFEKIFKYKEFNKSELKDFSNEWFRLTENEELLPKIHDLLIGSGFETPKRNKNLIIPVFQYFERTDEYMEKYPNEDRLYSKNTGATYFSFNFAINREHFDFSCEVTGKPESNPNSKYSFIASGLIDIVQLSEVSIPKIKEDKTLYMQGAFTNIESELLLYWNLENLTPEQIEASKQDSLKEFAKFENEISKAEATIKEICQKYNLSVKKIAGIHQDNGKLDKYLFGVSTVMYYDDEEKRTTSDFNKLILAIKTVYQSNFYKLFDANKALFLRAINKKFQ